MKKFPIFDVYGQEAERLLNAKKISGLDSLYWEY